MRSPNPSRRRPAHASTSASNPPASSLASRVSTLPRIGANVAPPRRGASCAARRTLPVPMIAPAPSRSSASETDRGSCGRGSTSPSRASSLGRHAATPSPSGSSTGRSFALCTARSASPRRSASSSSFTNCRLLSSPATGVCWERSPVVVTTTTSVCAPAARRRSDTACACHRASRLPRVAILNTRGVVNGAALQGQSARLDPRACRCRSCLPASGQTAGAALQRGRRRGYRLRPSSGARLG